MDKITKYTTAVIILLGAALGLPAAHAKLARPAAVPEPIVSESAPSAETTIARRPPRAPRSPRHRSRGRHHRNQPHPNRVEEHPRRETAPTPDGRRPHTAPHRPPVRRVPAPRPPHR